MKATSLGRGVIALAALGSLAACQRAAPAAPALPHLGPATWTSERWQQRCRGVRTSYNPDRDLSDATLTLVPGDQRWLDFVYWAINNKVAEHQVEAYGGTDWNGPKGGVIFHWAPGSHWERDTLASFGFAIGHVTGEHRWQDTMFPDFFEKYGGVYGVNIKDRLAEIDPRSPNPWVEFLEYSGGAKSPLYRYLFHRDAVVDPAARKLYLIAGDGVAFTYSFERYYHEVREVLTDCRAVDFFEMYDRLGPGFAARANWARQSSPERAAGAVGYVDAKGPQPGVGEAHRYDPSPPAVEVPATLPEADAMRRGQKTYLAQCAVCHGVRGDGAGFLAGGFDVQPRDFRAGTYKFRSTETGELPTMADVERTIRVGVPGTAMPAWGQFLPDQDIHDVARYLVVFSSRFVEEWKTGAKPAVLVASAKPEGLATLAARGAEVYRTAGCASCHGPGGLGDGPSARTLKDEWGQPIRAANLTYKWSFKAGHEPEDIYRTLLGGLNGTPMPSYAGALNEKDLWAISSYVLSLSPAERPVLHLAEFAAKRAERIGADGHVVPPSTATGRRP